MENIDLSNRSFTLICNSKDSWCWLYFMEKKLSPEYGHHAKLSPIRYNSHYLNGNLHFLILPLPNPITENYFPESHCPVFVQAESSFVPWWPSIGYTEIKPNFASTVFSELSQSLSSGTLLEIIYTLHLSKHMKISKKWQKRNNNTLT